MKRIQFNTVHCICLIQSHTLKNIAGNKNLAVAKDSFGENGHQ